MIEGMGRYFFLGGHTYKLNKITFKVMKETGLKEKRMVLEYWNLVMVGCIKECSRMIIIMVRVKLFFTIFLGELHYPNGDTYEGGFKNGKVYLTSNNNIETRLW